MFDISAHDLSTMFWNRLLHLSGWDVKEAVDVVSLHGDECEVMRPRMDYQTGSIPISTAVWLYLLAKQLRPRNVVEVGTFIGKSTMALAAGMCGGNIWTCDGSNDFLVPNGTPTKILGHGKTMSADMLRGISDLADLIFYDGRVHAEDLEHVRRLTHDRTILAFDDFEGTEKGVANVAIVRSPGLALIYPPSPELLKHYGVGDRSTLALLVPNVLFRFTSQ